MKQIKYQELTNESGGHPWKYSREVDEGQENIYIEWTFERLVEKEMYIVTVDTGGSRRSEENQGETGSKKERKERAFEGEEDQES